GFLRQIIGQGNICACELSKKTAHARLVPSHQFAKRVLIVISKNSRDKVRISELHGFNTMVLAEEEKERSSCPPISTQADSQGRSKMEYARSTIRRLPTRSQRRRRSSNRALPWPK